MTQTMASQYEVRGSCRKNEPCAFFSNTFRCPQLMVFNRREPIQKFLDTCRGKLHIGKKAKGAALLEGEEVCLQCVKSDVGPRLPGL